MLGEGLIGLVFPKRYSLLWKIGPEPLKKAMEEIAKNPEMARLIYVAEAGLGFWLAASQVKSLTSGKRQ
ncbi:MAG: hypothetical protein ACR2HG_01550 [Pyrinomonadaceae bacterium]